MRTNPGIRIALLNSRGDYVRVHYLEAGEKCEDGFFAGVVFSAIEVDWEPKGGWGNFNDRQTLGSESWHSKS